MMIFPEGAQPEPREALAAEEIHAEVTGFWTIYDELAMQDSLNVVSDGGPMNTPLFSTNMVLRVDGQASRGSDFPGGEWSLVEDGIRRRLKMVLRNRRLQQERRYDGLLFSLSMADPEAMPQDELVKAAMGSDDGAGAVDGSSTLRIVGTVTTWNVTSPNGEGAVMIGDKVSFSMVKLAVDRTKLVPTIKPWSRELTPEELEEEMKTQRAKDREDAEEIRKLINDVREAKKNGSWTGPSSLDSVEQVQWGRLGAKESTDGETSEGNRSDEELLP